MNYLLHIFTGQVILGIVVLIVFAVIMLLVFWPRKKLCQQCKKEKTQNKNAICDDCCHEQLLQKAKNESPKLLCPLHGDVMKTLIVLDIEGIVLHECPNQACDYIVMHKECLQKITLIDLEFYPTREVKE